MAEVVYDRVSKRYDDVTAIRTLSLAVADREFMVLVGPSGSGKTTLLRLLAGLETVTAGSIRIGDHVVDGWPPQDRDIAMVFQSSALYPHMTVRENMDFGLRVKGTARAEIQQRVAAAAQVLDLGSLLERKPRQLSGGQRQRVAVGRAIVRQPAVFLFDEPLSSLEPQLRVQMRGEIAALQRRLQTTTLYVTHDQVEAMTMGHRIAVLDAGALHQVGTPLELYTAPTNLFVARFIGSPPMNIIAGQVTADGAGVVAAGAFVALPPALQVAAAGARGRQVLVGVRPEHLRLVASQGGTRGDDGPPPASLQVTVELVEMLGEASLVHGRLGDAALIARVAAGVRPAVGSAVAFAIDPERLHLFDPRTGRCLTSDAARSATQR